MTRYRWTLGKRHGDWKESREAALADATEAGYARHDEQYGKLMKDELLEIEEERT